MARFGIRLCLILAFGTVNCLQTAEEALDLASNLLVDKAPIFDSKIFDKLNRFFSHYRDSKNKVLSTDGVRRLQDRFNRVDESIWYVNLAFGRAVNFTQKTYNINTQLRNIKTSTCSDGLSFDVEKIHNQVNEDEFTDPSIITVLTYSIKDPETNCVDKESAEQLFNELYDIIVSTEIESLVVQLRSYELIEILSGNSLADLKKEVTNRFVLRISITRNNVQTALDYISQKAAECH